MNPFTSKDGSRFTNRSTMKQHEARTASKMGGAAARAMAAGPVDADETEGAGDPNEGQAQDGAAMADEHGPAVEVSVHHDHEAGKHSVHASHPDGHEHDTQHGSADDAHKFAADCAGCGAGGGDAMGMQD